MHNNTKLRIIKIAHTGIWQFFNFVIFYMLYAAIVGKIDVWLWMGFGVFMVEGLILLAFKFFCPLTIMARKYSDSLEANFDIYLPKWLARENKLIYSVILGIIMIITIYQLLR